MTIKIRYNRAFDVESVCPGDVLMDRADNDIIYIIVLCVPESEEYLCLRLNGSGTVKSLLHRIGFESIDQYLKVEIYDTVG